MAFLFGKSKQEAPAPPPRIDRVRLDAYAACAASAGNSTITVGAYVLPIQDAFAAQFEYDRHYFEHGPAYVVVVKPAKEAQQEVVSRVQHMSQIDMVVTREHAASHVVQPGYGRDVTIAHVYHGRIKFDKVDSRLLVVLLAGDAANMSLVHRLLAEFERDGANVSDCTDGAYVRARAGTRFSFGHNESSSSSSLYSGSSRSSNPVISPESLLIGKVVERRGDDVILAGYAHDNATISTSTVKAWSVCNE